MGGISAELEGGNFGSGFASAGFTAALSGEISKINPGTTEGYFERIAVASVVGGTASAISGGKFANGAITGAFSRALNDEALPDVKISIGAKIGRILQIGANSDAEMKLALKVSHSVELEIDNEGTVKATVEGKPFSVGATSQIGGLKRSLDAFTKASEEWSSMKLTVRDLGDGRTLITYQIKPPGILGRYSPAIEIKANVDFQQVILHSSLGSGTQRNAEYYRQADDAAELAGRCVRGGNCSER